MRILFILFNFLGVVCLFSLSAQGQISDELSVEESVQLGLEHNYRLQAARADAEEAQAAYRQTRANRLPNIQSQASYMRLSDNIPEVDFTIPGIDTTFTVLPVELNRFHTEVSIEQPLFTGGRLNRQRKAAAHQADAAGLMEEQEKADVAFEIRQAYWNLYHALVANQTLESALAQVEEHLRNVRARVEEGTAIQTDLLNAETRRSEVLLDQVDTRSRVRVARLELNRLIGLPAGTQTEPVPPEDPGEVPFEMDELVERALKQRPGLHALSEQVSAREAEIRAAQSGWLPEISLVGRYIHARPNQYFFAEQDQFRGTWEAGVSLRWNIWAGGQRLSETSQARARLQSAEAGLAEMREQVTVEVARHYLEMERAMEAIDVAAASVEAAEEAFRSAREQFKEGAILSEKVLDAEYAYRSAQARHAEAVADFEISQAAVLNTLGQIWHGENGF